MNRLPSGELLSLANLAAFVVTCRTGSYTQAADQLSLSQPAVHHQVRKLESQLGVGLVYIRDRRVVPTEFGELVLRYGEDLIRSAEALHDQINLARTEPSDIRVAAYSLMAVGAVSDAIRNFRSRHPDKRVTVITVSHGDDAPRGVAAGKFDFLLGYSSYVPDTLTIHPLMGVPSAFAAAANHPLVLKSQLQPIEADELATYPFALTPKGFILRTAVDDWFATFGLVPSVGYEAPTGALLAQAVAGSDELVTCLAVDAIEAFNLHPVVSRRSSGRSQPVICHLPGRRLSLVEQSFLSSVKAAFAERAALYPDPEVAMAIEDSAPIAR